MKIAICSDSHDRMDKILKFVDFVINKKVNLVIHLGDFVAPFTFKFGFNKLKEHNISFLGIFGNNDGEVFGLLKTCYGEIYKPPYFCEIFNKKFLLMHEPYFVENLSLKDVDYILYGHTHKQDIRKKENYTIINPGELCGYLTKKANFVILDLENNKIEKVEV